MSHSQCVPREGDAGATRQQDALEPVSVLVVEDEQDTRDLLALVVSKAGYSVRTAENGQQALEMLQTVRPSLILLDVQMPVMDGAEFRQAMRRDRSLLKIPTVVLTGAAVEPMLDIAVDEALRKPVKSADLLAIVRRHCGDPH
ncbi:MAG: response regulator [Kofleriaceae bacterium]|nr:response regulator [Kofleriaceae bacterium]